MVTNKAQKQVTIQLDQKEKRAVLSIGGFTSGDHMIEHAIISVLTNTTAMIFFKKWVEEYLKETFHYEEEMEIQSIVETAKSLFYPSPTHKEQKTLITFIQWQQEIYQKIAPFVKENISFSFDSFLYFRLQTCKESLLSIVETAIDEYRMEIDYQMMLQRCRDFLNSHEPRIETVYVRLSRGIDFFDGKHQQIPFHQICQWLETATPFEKFLPIHERMIGPLVSMAPAKIMIHSEECDDDLFHTLKNIFEERIVLIDDKANELSTCNHPRFKFLS